MTRVPKVGDVVCFKDVEAGEALYKACLLRQELSPEIKESNPLKTYAWAVDHSQHFEESEIAALKRFADECEVFYKEHGYPA